jgi:hypothetical protein
VKVGKYLHVVAAFPWLIDTILSFKQHELVDISSSLLCASLTFTPTLDASEGPMI